MTPFDEASLMHQLYIIFAPATGIILGWRVAQRGVVYYREKAQMWEARYDALEKRVIDQGLLNIREPKNPRDGTH